MAAKLLLPLMLFILGTGLNWLGIRSIAEDRGSLRSACGYLSFVAGLSLYGIAYGSFWARF